LDIVAILLDERAKLALAIVFSVAIRVVVAELPRRLVARFEHPWLVEALRLIYYLGLPYLALLGGFASPRLFGLTAIDWPRSLAVGALLAAGAFVLLVLIGWYYARATRNFALCDRSFATFRTGPFAAPLGDLARPLGWVFSLRDAIYLEAHWTFYRAGPMLILGDYGGVFVGLAIALVEGYLDPTVRRHLSKPGSAEQPLFVASLAVAMTVVFFFTRNLWLCIALHAAMQFGLLRLWAAFVRPTPAAGQDSVT
jgi:hypothetical protein